MVQAVITITAFILVAIMLLGFAISRFIGSKKIEKLAMASGICFGCLVIIWGLGACIWLFVSFILSPSATWNYIFGLEKIWLKEDLASLPPLILLIAFLFGSWWIFEKGNVIAKLRGVFRVRNTVRPKGETKKIHTIKEIKAYIIEGVEVYASMLGLDWTQRFMLLLYGPATMLLFVIALVASVIISHIFFVLLTLVWLLLFLSYSFYEAYSTGIDWGYEVANKPEQKTIEIQNTWPSRIYHACKTFIALSLVIFILPWFIVYRLGKWKGRRDYCIRKKEYQEPTDEKEIDAWRKFRDSRAQHYVFVHQILRDLFFDTPDKIIAILRDEGSNDSLLDLWNKVGEEVGESRLVAANGLCCETRMLDDTLITIITLPTPQTLNEAYFVALVYRPYSKVKEAVTRFITLEHSIDLGGGGPSNVLCEWDGSVHYNMDYRCQSTLEDFFENVCNIL